MKPRHARRSVPCATEVAYGGTGVITRRAAWEPPSHGPSQRRQRRQRPRPASWRKSKWPIRRRRAAILIAVPSVLVAEPAEQSGEEKPANESPSAEPSSRAKCLDKRGGGKPWHRKWRNRAEIIEIRIILHHRSRDWARRHRAQAQARRRPGGGRPPRRQSRFSYRVAAIIARNRMLKLVGMCLARADERRGVYQQKCVAGRGAWRGGGSAANIVIVGLGGPMSA